MTRPPRHRSRISHLIAPLFVISLMLHGLLLFFPLPSDSEDASEETTEEPEPPEEAVDLLSISSLATEEPEPISEPPAEAPPPEATAPQPQPASQPVVPNVNPEAPPPAEPPPSPESASADLSAPEPASADGPSSNFDPARQQQLVGNAASLLGREPGKSNFDITSGFPGNAWDLPFWKMDLSRWSAQKRNCFFSSIDADSYTLAAGASDLRYLSRNLGLVINDDLSRTFSDQTVQPIEEGYCGERLFEISENGTPILWVSIIGMGDGNPPATAIVVLWSQNPRG